MLLVLAVWIGVGVIGTVALFIAPHSHPNQKRFSCQNNLSQLGGLYVACSEDPAWRPRAGPALFLEWRKDGKRIRPGQEGVLVCPGDQHVVPPDTPELRARYDAVDLDDPPDDLCSYAVRDFVRFPVDPQAGKPEPIAACVGRIVDGEWQAFHKGGFVIVYDDGASRFIEWSECGVDPPGDWPDPTVVVGPDSPVPELRTLCFRPAR